MARFSKCRALLYRASLLRLAFGNAVSGDKLSVAFDTYAPGGTWTLPMLDSSRKYAMISFQRSISQFVASHFECPSGHAFPAG